MSLAASVRSEQAFSIVDEIFLIRGEIAAAKGINLPRDGKLLHRYRDEVALADAVSDRVNGHGFGDRGGEITEASSHSCLLN